jgi:hypothetical protein
MLATKSDSTDKLGRVEKVAVEKVSKKELVGFSLNL